VITSIRIDDVLGNHTADQKILGTLMLLTVPDVSSSRV
jgi:hypothetical protein